jgi:hypothetical protein
MSYALEQFISRYTPIKYTHKKNILVAVERVIIIFFFLLISTLCGELSFTPKGIKNS